VNNRTKGLVGLATIGALALTLIAGAAPASASTLIVISNKTAVLTGTSLVVTADFVVDAGVTNASGTFTDATTGELVGSFTLGNTGTYTGVTATLVSANTQVGDTIDIDVTFTLPGGGPGTYPEQVTVTAAVVNNAPVKPNLGIGDQPMTDASALALPYGIAGAVVLLVTLSAVAMVSTVRKRRAQAR
jgi:hypothetical protein